MNGIDILSYKMGQQSGGGSSDGGAEVKYKSAYVTLSGTWGQRIAIDFGFKPDLIFIMPSALTLAGGICYQGISNKFAEKMGTTVSTSYTTYGSVSQKTARSAFGTAIDDPTDNAPIYAADETGFNLGKIASPGSAYVFAIGI